MWLGYEGGLGLGKGGRPVPRDLPEIGGGSVITDEGFLSLSSSGALDSHRSRSLLPLGVSQVSRAQEISPRLVVNLTVFYSLESRSLTPYAI